jgi:hypothetical protein
MSYLGEINCWKQHSLLSFLGFGDYFREEFWLFAQDELDSDSLISSMG